MATSGLALNRRVLLAGLAAMSALPEKLRSQQKRPKALLVVAHPDDEYTFAATVYRFVRELGGEADQVVITDGEGGYRYSALAESIYGVSLTKESEGRARLPAIRKQETLNAGRILGIRKHYFLDQKDSGFGTDASGATTANWDKPKIVEFLRDLLARERYDVLFTLLPTSETHGHHREATLLALDAVSHLPEEARPIALDGDPGRKDARPAGYHGLAGFPVTRTIQDGPAVIFDRTTAFGYHDSLNYEIVVNWVIAEHKSQGLFNPRVRSTMSSGSGFLRSAAKMRLAGPSNSHNGSAERRDTSEDTLKTLSRRCKYALRALYPADARLPARPGPHCAHRRQGTDPAQIFGSDSGPVAGPPNRGQPGRQERSILPAPPEIVAIGPVVRIIDGPLAPLPCASETAYQPCDECEDEARCETKFVMREVRNAIAGVLDRVTLAEVCAKDSGSKAAGASLSDVV